MEAPGHRSESEPSEPSRGAAGRWHEAKAESLLALLREDPFRRPPPFETLVGDLSGAYSRRINIQRRLVYEVLAAERTVKVLRLWTHE